MISDVLLVAQNCHSCATTRGTIRKHHKYLKLIPAAGPLEFVAMDTLGPLLRTERGHQFVLIVTYWCSKLVCSEPLRATTATVVANTFLDHWLYAYSALA